MKFKRKLSMGDELSASGTTITIGPVSLDLERQVTRRDVEAICTFYAMGLAARSRFVSASLQQFFKSTEPVEILGYDDPN